MKPNRDRSVDWNKGTHDWKLAQEYHECPHCGYIVESFELYKEHFNELYKEVYCERCKQMFTVKKTKPKTFGPLMEK